MGVIVIVPERDRGAQLEKLVPQLRRRGVDRVVVCSQPVGAPFNRGLVKNVGFLMARPAPADVVVFHDADLLPGPAFPATYPALCQGSIAHLYGHRHCLGGIVATHPDTFLSLNGFCNSQWAWGGEDRWLQRSAEAVGVRIDRSTFVDRFADNAFVTEMAADGTQTSATRAAALFAQSLGSHRLCPSTWYRSGGIGYLFARPLSALATRVALPEPPVERWMIRPELIATLLSATAT